VFPNASVQPSGGILDRAFDLSKHKTTAGREVVAGLTTFFVMAYILFVNPIILGFVGVEGLEGMGLPPTATLTATALVAGVMTILMGIYANKALAIASGMGLNAVVAFQLIAAEGLTPEAAMGVIVWEGIAIFVLTRTNLRETMMRAIPTELKRAIAVGIGFFIAFIGFVNAGFVTAGAGTPVQLGQLTGFPMLVFVFGLAVTVALRSLSDHLPGLLGKMYLLVGILAATLFAIVGNTVYHDSKAFMPGTAVWPDRIVAEPDFSTVGEISLFGVFSTLGLVAALLVIFSIMLSDYFDSMGTFVGVGEKAGYLDEDGNFRDVRKPLTVDSLAAIAGGAASASSATTYIESAAGVEAGGRTGLTSVVTGICFLAAMFISPLAGIIPAEATAPALILVGWMMMSSLAQAETKADEAQGTVSGPRMAIPFGTFEVGFPAAMTILIMPLTYSITNGIGAGIVTYAFIQIFVGKGRQVHPALWLITAAFLLYFLQPVLHNMGIG
jgi:AGZA family xanthine/uracil permease-like MFS transporter